MKLKKKVSKLFKRKSLDYLLVPTGWDRQRKERALKEFKKRNIKKILILDGNNSEEDILYLGRLLKKGDKVGFVTFPLHYKEYKEIIKKAKKQGKFPKKIKIINIKTKQTFKQKIYGILGLTEERLEKGKLKYAKKKHENYFILKIRRFVKRILG